MAVRWGRHDDEVDLRVTGDPFTRGEDLDPRVVAFGLGPAFAVEVGDDAQLEPRRGADAVPVDPADRRRVAEQAHPKRRRFESLAGQRPHHPVEELLDVEALEATEGGAGRLPVPDRPPHEHRQAAILPVGAGHAPRRRRRRSRRTPGTAPAM